MLLSDVFDSEIVWFGSAQICTLVHSRTCHTHDYYPCYYHNDHCDLPQGYRNCLAVRNFSVAASNVQRGSQHQTKYLSAQYENHKLRCSQSVNLLSMLTVRWLLWS